MLHCCMRRAISAAFTQEVLGFLVYHHPLPAWKTACMSRAARYCLLDICQKDLIRSKRKAPGQRMNRLARMHHLLNLFEIPAVIKASRPLHVFLPGINRGCAAAFLMVQQKNLPRQPQDVSRGVYMCLPQDRVPTWVLVL